LAKEDIVSKSTYEIVKNRTELIID